VSNELPREKRLAVLSALVDGNSERACERITERMGLGVTQKTIGLFALRLGKAAQHLHNALAHDIATPLMELDEIWSYVGKKQSRVTDAEHAAGLGEAYSFVGLAMPSRFVVGWKVGKRDEATCDAFAEDIRSRLVTMPSITSDGFAPYIPAIGKHFGPGVNYAQTVKHYRSGARKDDDHRYEPARDPFVTKHVIFGAPNLDEATTAHIERFNGTTRHIVGRMRRLVCAFSKKPENHAASVALHYVYYNMCWLYQEKGGKKQTPAMAARVTDHLWDVDELLDALLAAEPCAAPAKKPIGVPVPATTSRPLPGGRGFLRIVPGPSGPKAPSPGPAPSPPPAPVAPAAPDPRQLDLFAPRPAKPLPPVGSQLSLFGIDIDPEPPT
jgi:IS1 family transposase